MQVRTKRRHTDTVELCIIGPKANVDGVIRDIEKHGFVNISESIPWNLLFPEFEGESCYSVALRGARRKAGLTQVELARITGIPQGHISRMENSRMEIGKDRAKRLARALDIDYRVFL